MIKIRLKVANDIDRHNAYTAKIIAMPLDDVLILTLWTDSRGQGLWINGMQALGTSQFDIGKNAAAAYRRYLSRRFS